MKNIRKLTKTNLNHENKELTQAGNILKGYVNYLRRRTLLGFQIEEKNKIFNIQSKKKSCESSKNLEINIKKKNLRKLSYNYDNNRILNIPIQAKLRKNNSFRHEINLEFNTLKKKYGNIKPKIPNIPKKSYSNNIKIIDEKSIQTVKKKQFLENNELFSLFKNPQYFEGENTDSNSIILENKDNSISGLSCKNILQLNEIKKELRETFLGKKKNINEILNKKSFINDDIEDLEYSNYILNDNINEFEKEKYRILTRKGYVYDSFDEEENLDEIEIYKNLSPDSFIIKFIDFLVFISVFYNLLYLPIFLAYNNIYCYTGNYYTYGNIIENVIDIIFIIDIVITFFVSFYNFEETLILDYKSIAKNYLHNWFFIDLISAIPIKTILTIFNKKCYNKGFLINPLYNHNFYYLLILIRLIKTFQVIFKNKFYQYLEIKLSKFNIFNKYFRFFISLIIFLFSLHLVSCIFIFIGKNDYPNWIINFNHQNKSFIELYIIAIYYTIETVTTVGYGDLFCTTLIEKIFGLIIEIFGIVAYSWALTSMINYVRGFTDKEEGLISKLRILDDIKLNYPQLNEDLFERIQRFLKYTHESEQKDSHIIFEDLPITLRNTLIYEMYKPMINGFIFFKNFSNSDFIVKIILALKPILALRNDILIKDGDFVEDIIFVKKGKLSLELPLDFSSPKKIRSFKKSSITFNRDNTLSQFNTNSFNFKSKKLNYCNTVARVQTIENKENIQNYRILQIRKNEHFGDILMFLNQRSRLCLKVKSKKAELFFLNKSDAINISTIYPQYWKKINKKSLFNMEQIKRLINKITRLIKNIYGHPAHIKKHIRRIPSVLTDSYIDIIGENDYELKSIPSITDETEIMNSLIYDDIKKGYLNNEHDKDYNKRDNQNKYQKNLKTIVENENNSSSSCFSSSLSSHTSIYNSKNQLISNKENKQTYNSKSKNNILDKIYNNIDKDKKRINKKNITPYAEEEINNEIYPEETFIITGGPNKINKNLINNNFIQDNISICSTESFSISSEYENINELCEYQYSKDKKIRKQIKNYIKEGILKNKSLTKSTISANSDNYSKDSILKNINDNTGSNKKNQDYKKLPSSLNPIPKSFESYGFEKKNIEKENFIRNNSGKITNLKFNKMLSYQDKDFPQSNIKGNKKEKEILDFIGHNIKKNVMILNNPEQFYSEFFINVMNKKNKHTNLKKKDNLNYEFEKKISFIDKELKNNT